MSSLANWSYTAKATIWRSNGVDDDGIQTFEPPFIIDCDYGSNLAFAKHDIGREQVKGFTIWTEYSLASVGDYILIGESSESSPFTVGADEVINVLQYADTFNRSRDDYAILTGGKNGGKG